MNFFPISPFPSLRLCIELATTLLYSEGPVLIKFSAEASLELCVEGGGIREWVAMETKAFNKRRCGALSVKPYAVTTKKGNSSIARMPPRTENTSSIKHKFYDATFFPAFFFYFSYNLWLIKISGTHSEYDSAVLKEMKIFT